MKSGAVLMLAQVLAHCIVYGSLGLCMCLETVALATIVVSIVPELPSEAGE